MSDGNWLKRNQANIGKWLLRVPITTTVLIIGGGAIVRGLVEQSEYEWSSNQRNAEYTAEAYGPAYDACFGLSSQGQPECIAKANNEYRENERKEKDLIAQQTTAVWTFLMGCAAIIGMMLSGLGVYLVFTTFNETRKANEIARESLIADNRAWLRATTNTGIGIRFYNNSMAANTFFSVENVGRSVATDVKVYAFFQIIGAGDIVGFGKDQLPPPVYTADRNGLSIWPDKYHEFKRHVPGACPELVGIPKGSFQVLMKVVVSYKTIYDTSKDKDRITESIYEVIPVRYRFDDSTIPSRAGDENIVSCDVELISAGGWRIT